MGFIYSMLSSIHKEIFSLELRADHILWISVDTLYLSEFYSYNTLNLLNLNTYLFYSKTNSPSKERCKDLSRITWIVILVTYLPTIYIRVILVNIFSK